MRTNVRVNIPIDQNAKNLLLAKLHNAGANVQTVIAGLNQQEQQLLRAISANTIVDPNVVALQPNQWVELGDDQYNVIEFAGGAFDISEYKGKMIQTAMTIFNANAAEAVRLLSFAAITVATKGANALLYQNFPNLIVPMPQFFASFPIGRGFATSEKFSFFRLKICFANAIVKWRASNGLWLNSNVYQNVNPMIAVFGSQECVFVAPDDMIVNQAYLAEIIRKVQSVQQQVQNGQRNQIMGDQAMAQQIDAQRLVTQMLQKRATMVDQDFTSAYHATPNEIGAQVQALLDAYYNA